jgi:thioredoxin 1
VAPELEKLAAEHEGKLIVAKLNSDENPRASERHGIRAIPTLILFKGGQVFDQITGVVSRGALEKSIQKAVDGEASARPFVVAE